MGVGWPDNVRKPGAISTPTQLSEALNTWS